MPPKTITTVDYTGPDRRTTNGVWPRLVPILISLVILTIGAASFMIRAHSYTVHEADFKLFYPLAAGNTVETRLTAMGETLHEIKADLKEIKTWLRGRPARA